MTGEEENAISAKLTYLTRLRILMAQGFRHPSWIAGHIVNVIAQIQSKGASTDVPMPVGVSYALGQLFPEDTARLEPILAVAPAFPAVSIVRRAASPLLAQTCYVLVHLLKPRSVIEIGVAEGVTSFYLLAGLQTVSGGSLTSIDLPGLTPAWRTETGKAVPAEFHPYWSLVLGPSRFKLPRVLKQLGAIDLAVHDGTHHAVDQVREYQLLWDHLRPGGVLLSDDVDNGAMTAFAETVKTPMFVVAKQSVTNGLFGLMRKPVSMPGEDSRQETCRS